MIRFSIKLKYKDVESNFKQGPFTNAAILELLTFF